MKESEAAGERIARHLHVLVNEIGERPPGAPGNRAATRYAAQVLRQAGWEAAEPDFPCTHWEEEGAELRLGERRIPLHVGPWSQPFEGQGELAVAGTRAELERLEAEGRILLLHGELVREQLMPKNFPFYSPEHHRELLALLEAKAPAAILAATGRNPELAGSLDPFPLLEDGDVTIPNACLKEIRGRELLRHRGEGVELSIRSTLIPAKGCNVVATNAASGEPRSLLVAHVDTKHGTPGALDNGAGVATLLAFAESWGDPGLAPPVEIVLFNGEDNWAVPGQLHYLESFDASRVELVVNLDAPGYLHGASALSSYNLDDPSRQRLEELVDELEGVVTGPPWMQSDHAIFAQMGLPALAITSQRTQEVFSRITHTAADTLAVVDADRLAPLVPALGSLLVHPALRRAAAGPGAAASAG